MDKRDDEKNRIGMIENTLDKPMKPKDILSNDEKNKITHYFTAKKPIFDLALFVTGTVIIIALGAPILWIGHWGDVECCTVSGIVIAFTGFFIMIGAVFKYVIAKNNYDSREDDNKIDEWRDMYIEKISKNSIMKVNLDESELITEKIVMVGAWRDLSSESPVKFAFGRDNRVRFSHTKVTILFLTQDQFIFYNCIFNLMTGDLFQEKTEEYFYKDIVAIMNILEDSSEYLRLTTIGGNIINIFLGNRKTISGKEIPVTSSEKALHAIRKMIREKKI